MGGCIYVRALLFPKGLCQLDWMFSQKNANIDRRCPILDLHPFVEEWRRGQTGSSVLDIQLHGIKRAWLILFSQVW